MDMLSVALSGLLGVVFGSVAWSKKDQKELAKPPYVQDQVAG
jgi:hypothetical protein